MDERVVSTSRNYRKKSKGDTCIQSTEHSNAMVSEWPLILLTTQSNQLPRVEVIPAKVNVVRAFQTLFYALNVHSLI